MKRRSFLLGATDMLAAEQFSQIRQSKDLNLLMAHVNTHAINKVLLMPGVVQRFDGYGVEDGGGSVDDFASFMAIEYEKWGKVVRAANIRADS